MSHERIKAERIIMATHPPTYPLWRIRMETGEGNDCHADFTMERNWNNGEWAVEVEGFLKFDGCLNWSTTTGIAAHLCGPEDFERMARAFYAIWEMGPEVMPRAWNP